MKDPYQYYDNTTTYNCFVITYRRAWYLDRGGDTPGLHRLIHVQKHFDCIDDICHGFKTIKIHGNYVWYLERGRDPPSLHRLPETLQVL